MAERYGWTPDQIDEVDRDRVIRWWSTSYVHGLADTHLQKFTAAQEQTMQGYDNMRQLRKRQAENEQPSSG